MDTILFFEKTLCSTDVVKSMFPSILASASASLFFDSDSLRKVYFTLLHVHLYRSPYVRKSKNLPGGGIAGYSRLGALRSRRGNILVVDFATHFRRMCSLLSVICRLCLIWQDKIVGRDITLMRVAGSPLQSHRRQTAKAAQLVPLLRVCFQPQPPRHSIPKAEHHGSSYWLQKAGHRIHRKATDA